MSAATATVTTDDLLTIDAMGVGDLPFIVETWLRSFQNSPRGLRTEDYWTVQRTLCERLLGSAETLVMRPRDWDEGIVGWLCGERRGAEHIVHYAYVQNGGRDKRHPGYRRMGIASRLIAEQRGDATNLSYTHLRPPHCAMLERRGYVYDRGKLPRNKR